MENAYPSSDFGPPAYFLGDYLGLTSVGNDFLAMFGQTLSTPVSSNVFFRRVEHEEGGAAALPQALPSAGQAAPGLAAGGTVLRAVVAPLVPLPAAGADAAGLGGIANLPGAGLNFSNYTLDHNQAVGGEWHEGGNGLGGGIDSAGSTNFGVRSLPVAGSTITHNQAQAGAGDDGGSDGQGVGGSVCLDLFTSTNIFRNSAATSKDIFGSWAPC
jgi:hypothetical protein